MITKQSFERSYLNNLDRRHPKMRTSECLLLWILQLSARITKKLILIKNSVFEKVI